MDTRPSQQHFGGWTNEHGWGRDAGPEADVPVEQGEKWTARGALLGGWRQIWLCSIIRIYTHLPPFITCSWAVTLRAVAGTFGHGGNTDKTRMGYDVEQERRLAQKKRSEIRLAGSGWRWAVCGKTDQLCPLGTRFNPPWPG
jgi:hypothetical protein